MTDMDEWSDLDEFFVATIRRGQHGIGFVSVSSSIQSKDLESSHMDMMLVDDTQDLGEAIERNSTCSGQKRQVDMDRNSDDILAHERAKKKQRSWSRKQYKKAKMLAWNQAAGLEVQTNNVQ